MCYQAWHVPVNEKKKKKKKTSIKSQEKEIAEGF